MGTERESSAAWLPVPGQQLADAIDRMVGDAAEHLAQISFRVEFVELGSLNERVGGCGALPTGIRACEQIVLPAQHNLAVILPISGRTLWSNIAGIRCTDRGCVVFRASGAHRVSWCTWS